MSLPPFLLSKFAPFPTTLVGDNIIFYIEFTLNNTVTITSFSDSLPPLPSGAPWTIVDPSLANFFDITGSVGSQSLVILQTPLSSIAANTYSCGVTAVAGIAEVDTDVKNTVTLNYTIGGVQFHGTASGSTHINPSVSSISLTKKTTSDNVTPGDPINFEIELIVEGNPKITSFSDPLPAPSGGVWQILTQNTLNFFIITGSPGTQFLEINPSLLPNPIAAGTYNVTIVANTNVNDAGETFTNGITMVYVANGATLIATASAQARVAVCIHKSSMIRLAGGEEMGISELEPNQEIMGADGIVSALIEAVPCWVIDNNNVTLPCVIFEQDSLGPGVPSKRFAVDHGHPIATQEEYSKNGNKSLRPAISYLNESKTIYCTLWNEVSSLLPGENRRFDIIMKDDSCKAYIANGIVVQARQDRKEPGYPYIFDDMENDIVLNLPVLTQCSKHNKIV